MALGTLAALLLPWGASAQGLRSGTASVQLIAVKRDPAESPVRDLEIPPVWNGIASRVTVRLVDRGTGGPLYVRALTGRLEPVGTVATAVAATTLRFRVVQPGGGAVPPTAWRVEVQSTDAATGSAHAAVVTVTTR